MVRSIDARSAAWAKPLAISAAKSATRRIVIMAASGNDRRRGAIVAELAAKHLFADGIVAGTRPAMGVRCHPTLRDDICGSHSLSWDWAFFSAPLPVRLRTICA